jgi:hypothetical protein
MAVRLLYLAPIFRMRADVKYKGLSEMSRREAATPMKTYSLTAWIDTSKPETIERALRDLSPRRKIIHTDVGFFLKATVRGLDARLLNKHFLLALRSIEPRTALHAEWKTRNSTQWFFNYAQKRSRGTNSSHRPKLHQGGHARLTR